MIKRTIKVQTFIWLLAVSLNAFAALAVSAAPETPSNFVYCPLTHKLQPIKAEPPRAEKSDEICAPASEKTRFTELLISRGAALSNLEGARIQDLFFDYSRDGRVALSSVPSSPSTPRHSATTGELQLTTSVRRDSSRDEFKLLAAKFAIGLKPRGPSSSVKLPEAQNLDFPTAAILRRIAPRGPPAIL